MRRIEHLHARAASKRDARVVSGAPWWCTPSVEGCCAMLMREALSALAAISVPPRGLWAMLERWPDDVNDRSYLIEVAPERRGAVVSTCMQGRGCSAVEVAPERRGGRHSDALRCTQMHSPEGLGRHTAEPRCIEPLASADPGHTPPLRDACWGEAIARDHARGGCA